MTLDGDLIRKLRYERGISQEDLSCELDCSRSIIAKIEMNCRKETGLCIAYKLSQYFNLTINELIKK